MLDLFKNNKPIPVLTLDSIKLKDFIDYHGIDLNKEYNFSVDFITSINFENKTYSIMSIEKKTNYEYLLSALEEALKLISFLYIVRLCINDKPAINSIFYKNSK